MVYYIIKRTFNDLNTENLQSLMLCLTQVQLDIVYAVVQLSRINRVYIEMSGRCYCGTLFNLGNILA